MASSTRKREHDPKVVDTCYLCGRAHTHLSRPSSWKCADSKRHIQSQSVPLDSLICKVCRDKIRMVIQASMHESSSKDRQHECAVTECESTIGIHYTTKMSVDDIRLTIQSKGETLPDVVPRLTPLCNTHYHMAYKTLTTTQANCKTCGCSLRRSPRKTCPDPELVLRQLRENTGYESTLTADDAICYRCYRSHLHIVKQQRTVSTLLDLQELASDLAQSMPTANDLPTIDSVVEWALNEVTLHVAKEFLHHRVLLLKSAHDLFCQTLKGTCDLVKVEHSEATVTQRALLSHLTNTLQHHIRYNCKVKKYGTLLYRVEDDIVPFLTRILWKQILEQTSWHDSSTNDKTEPETECMEAIEHLNNKVHEQTRRFIKEDKCKPFDFTSLDIDQVISTIDPTLWQAICTLTQSISEKRGRPKAADQTCTTNEVKKNSSSFFALCCAVCYRRPLFISTPHPDNQHYRQPRRLHDSSKNAQQARSMCQLNDPIEIHSV